jgi:nitroimidazol reductase NimA-like FMN-containing flavoprotein (pyridoxamine 5'-phosphate oxidase superfamily)
MKQMECAMTGGKDFEVTALNKVRQVSEAAHYDWETVHAVLDAGLVCQVALIDDDQPIIVPMTYGRSGNRLYLHGARKARVIKALSAHPKACAHVTLCDGIVIARSTFNSSMNYRSATVFGKPTLVEDSDEKLAALEIISEHLVPGRWREVRPSLDREIKMTGVIRFDIESASAKVAAGPPEDEDEDYQSAVWAGVLPLALRAGELQADPALPGPIDPSEACLALQGKTY